MENIVYVLGAGFSAPLGLPVMADFLEMAKDQYAADNQKFSHFKGVFETIRDLSYVKNYYHANLFNIEEILSILEMQDHLDGQSRREAFTRFLSDVIKYRTPTHQPTDDRCTLRSLVGVDNWGPYGAFVAAILKVGVQTSQATPAYWTWREPNEPQKRYAIVTLNYDLVIEQAAHYVARAAGRDIKRIECCAEHNCAAPCLCLAKLHGSIDGKIIPPTWSKHLQDPEIVAEWKRARNALQAANQIRILGYSLPEADAYVKYLLKAAVLQCTNLKTIDVLCRDRDGSVGERYEKFIGQDKLRFRSLNIWDDYLHAHYIKYGGQTQNYTFHQLEEIHSAAFRN